MWAHLHRQGISRPVHRGADHAGPRVGGITRARTVRTTVADPADSGGPDLVRRRFTAGRPDELQLADFTYVPLTCAFY